MTPRLSRALLLAIALAATAVGLIVAGSLLALFSFYAIVRFAPCPTGETCPTSAVDPFWLAAGIALVVVGLVRGLLDRRSRDIARR